MQVFVRDGQPAVVDGDPQRRPIDLRHLDVGAVTLAADEVDVTADHPYVDRVYRVVDLDHRWLAERPLAHFGLLQTRYIANLRTRYIASSPRAQPPKFRDHGVRDP